MNQKEVLFRAIGDIGDDLIARADQPVKKKQNALWLRWSALAACCVLVVGIAAFARLSFSSEKTESVFDANGADCAAPEAALDIAPRNGAESDDDAKLSIAQTILDEEEAPQATEELGEASDETFEPEAALHGVIFFSGRRYGAVSPEQVDFDLLPGEKLGVVEDSEDESLLGCEIYACAKLNPAEWILLLCDEAYLPFRCEAAPAPAE